MITNLRLERDDQGNYWQHVQSESGKSASLNLSTVSKSELVRRALEEWAAEQIERAEKIIPTHDPN